jgi:3-hydroxybutyryl-CoA dehydratase
MTRAPSSETARRYGGEDNAMADFYVKVGDSSTFSKSVGEFDVYSFAGITGDFSPNHTNKAYMEKSSYGQSQAHGALMVCYMPTASTLAIAHTRASADETPVSLGYDRIRFLAPVRFGDTITVSYRISVVDVVARRSTGANEIHKQDGTLVAVGTHILKWVKNA